MAAAFRIVALLALYPALGAGWCLGRFTLPNRGDSTLVAGTVGILAAAIVYGLFVIVLKRSLGIEDERMRAFRENGILATLRADQAQHEADTRSEDPAVRAKHYGDMVFTSVAMSLGGVFGIWLSWTVDWALTYGLLLFVALALVGPFIALFYGVQYLRYAAKR